MKSIIESVKERCQGMILDVQKHSAKRIYCAARASDITKIAAVLFNELGLRFITASGCDTPDGVEILYHFSHDASGVIISIRIVLKDKKNLQVDSLAPLFAGAQWIEREIWELLGVDFIGHPNLEHLLLIDDWPKDNHPLRKDERHG